ncbi:hypothetical protein AB3G41_08595 [Mycobacterium kansasii]
MRRRSWQPRGARRGLRGGRQRGAAGLTNAADRPYFHWERMHLSRRATELAHRRQAGTAEKSRRADI